MPGTFLIFLSHSEFLFWFSIVFFFHRLLGLCRGIEEKFGGGFPPPSFEFGLLVWKLGVFPFAITSMIDLSHSRGVFLVDKGGTWLVILLS